MNRLILLLSLFSLSSAGNDFFSLKCYLAKKAFGYVEGKVKPTFMKPCLQYMSPIVKDCENGDDSILVEDVISQLCYEECSAVAASDLATKYDWIKETFTPPYGEAYVACVKDMAVSAEEDVQDVCNAVFHEESVGTVCDKVFCQIWGGFLNVAYKKLGCSPVSVDCKSVS